MNHILACLLVFIGGELLSTALYYFITKGYSKQVSLATLSRGWLERAFLFIVLLNDLPQALILFGALKIGTRLREGENKISNDYFLVGNLISVLLAIGYFLIVTKYIN